MAQERLLRLLEQVLRTYPQGSCCRGGYDIEDQITKEHLEKIVLSRKITPKDLLFIRSIIPEISGGRMLVRAVAEACEDITTE